MNKISEQLSIQRQISTITQPPVEAHYPHHKLVVLIPALNEEKTISSIIERIPKRMAGITSCEVIVIDDGSKDSTAEVSKKAGATVVQHRENRGVGAAFHTGIRAALEAGADSIVNIDADGQFNPEDIPSLLAPIQEGRAAFVTASRFADKKLEPKMPGIKKWGNKQITRLVNFITQKKFTDVSCGFRAYSREAALRLTLFGNFTYTQETFIDFAFKNIAITEVPLKIRGEREHGTSRVAGNLWRFGIKAGSIIFRAARDYRPQYFFGLPGLLTLIAGVGAGIFLLAHFLQTGQTYPYRSLVQVSGVLIIVGFMLLFLSMLADMMHRNRVILEEAVYHARSNAYKKNKE